MLNLQENFLKVVPDLFHLVRFNNQEFLNIMDNPLNVTFLKALSKYASLKDWNADNTNFDLDALDVSVGLEQLKKIQSGIIFAKLKIFILQIL